MAAYDVTVDGFSLNTLGWQADRLVGIEGQAPRVIRKLAAPGVDGGLDVPGEFESGEFSISLWVDGTHPTTGAAPTDAQFEKNLADVKRAMLSYTDLDVRVEMPDGSVRKAFCATSGPTPSERRTERDAQRVRLTYPMVVGRAHWSGVTPVTLNYASQQVNTIQTLTGLDVSTAPINDAIVRVVGPGTTPILEVLNEANVVVSSVSYTGTLAAGDAWILDASNFRSRKGAGITLSTQGVSVMGETDYKGAEPYLLKIWRPFKLRLRFASGTSTATAWSITAFPKF